MGRWDVKRAFLYTNCGDISVENKGKSEREALRGARTIILSGDIDDSSSRDFIQDMTIVTNNNPNKAPITVIIQSCGGEVPAGIACIRAIRSAQKDGIRVIGKVYGEAMSMAFLVLQACDDRIMGNLCTLMAHGVTAFTVGDTRNLEAERKLLKFWQSGFSDMLSNRCTKKDSVAAKPDFWFRIMEDDTPQFYSSNECLEMGIIDRVE